MTARVRKLGQAEMLHDFVAGEAAHLGIPMRVLERLAGRPVETYTVLGGADAVVAGRVRGADVLVERIEVAGCPRTPRDLDAEELRRLEDALFDEETRTPDENDDPEEHDNA